VGVTINNVEGELFQTCKGLREGDPLSPLLFNLVVDILSRMLQKPIGEGLIRGSREELVEGGVISLQYADDTIFLWTRTWGKLRISSGYWLALR
jgi:hypothetical protein